MNETDTQFYKEFLEAMAHRLDGFLESAYEEKGIRPTNVHSLQFKPIMRDGFYIQAQIDPTFQAFMDRNQLQFRDIEIAIFDKLWDVFSERYHITVC